MGVMSEDLHTRIIAVLLPKMSLPSFAKFGDDERPRLEKWNMYLLVYTSSI